MAVGFGDFCCSTGGRFERGRFDGSRLVRRLRTLGGSRFSGFLH
jgi:hypothetical protein